MKKIRFKFFKMRIRWDPRLVILTIGSAIIMGLLIATHPSREAVDAIVVSVMVIYMFAFSIIQFGSSD